MDTFRWILILPANQAFALPYISIIDSLDKVYFNLPCVNLRHHWHLLKSWSIWYGQANGKQTYTEFWRWKQAKISIPVSNFKQSCANKFILAITKKGRFLLSCSRYQNMIENFSLKALVGLSDVVRYIWAKSIE